MVNSCLRSMPNKKPSNGSRLKAKKSGGQPQTDRGNAILKARVSLATSKSERSKNMTTVFFLNDHVSTQARCQVHPYFGLLFVVGGNTDAVKWLVFIFDFGAVFHGTG